MAMKLYDSPLSPYAARVRIALYAKNLEVDLIQPANRVVGELEAASPLAKLPTLIHDGNVIPESEVINEYLEDIGTLPSLRPRDPLHCARMRVLSRICDLYIMYPMGELFGQISPVGRDQAIVDTQMAELLEAMGWLEKYLDGAVCYAVGAQLSLADCALAPVLFFFDQIGPMFGRVTPLKKYPNTQAYYTGIRKDPHVGRVLAEVDAAVRKMMAGG